MRRLSRTLLDASIDAYVLALETINRLSVAYRVQSFVFLFVNSWELMLKARLHEERANVFYRKARNQPRRSLSLDDCLNKLFTAAADPVKANIQMVSQLRNEAMHLAIPVIPPDVMGLFQAGVLNYARLLQEWFGISLAERVPLGMMTLVYDFDPATHSLEHATIRRRLNADVVEWLSDFQGSIRERAADFGESTRHFYVPIDIKLAFVRNPDKADVVLSPGAGGQPALVVEVPKDPDRTHPYRLTEAVENVNQQLGEDDKINREDILAVKVAHEIPKKPNYHYLSKIPGRSPQYSEAFVSWMLEKRAKDPSFFLRARAKKREMQGRSG